MDWSSDVCSSDLDLAELADAAEIRSAEEGGPGLDLVEVALRQRVVHPESGEGRRLLPEAGGDVAMADREVGRVVQHLGAVAPSIAYIRTVFGKNIPTCWKEIG